MGFIFHLDMDAFFASVEIACNPALKGKPVIVGGRPDSRGVVSTCSYEARAFGVRSAMSVSEAYRLCPQGIFIEGNYATYRDYSDRIFHLLYEYTPLIEVVSIDEAYLDVTPALTRFTSAKALATEIKQCIFKETALTCSIGIANSKLISKIAAAKAKPNGIFEVAHGDEKQFLATLGIQQLPGIGEKTRRHMNREGIFLIKDLQALTIDQLIFLYGSAGYYFFYASQGIDHRKVDWEEHPPKSIGAETTFECDLSDEELLTKELVTLLKKAHKRLCAHQMRTRRIQMKLRYADFTTITRSRTLPMHINDLENLESACLNLFYENYSGDPPLRLVGLSLEQLSNTYWQPLLFEG